MGMTNPLGGMGIKVTTYHDISKGLENKCLVYIGPQGQNKMTKLANENMKVA